MFNQIPKLVFSSFYLPLSFRRSPIWILQFSAIPAAGDASKARGSASPPSAKKRLAFSGSDEAHLDILASAASGVSDTDLVDVAPLTNLRSRARARWASKRPIESEIDNSLLVSTKSIPPSVDVPALAQVASKRFTRSQAAKSIAEICPSKKRRSAETQGESSRVPPIDDDSGNISDSLPSYEPDVVCPGPLFFRSTLHMDMWDCITGRTFIREHSLHPDKANHACIIDLLSEIGLSKTVLHVQSFVKQVVIEFYCNLSLDVPKTGKTFIRGQHIKFSPSVINSLVGFTPILGVNMDGGMYLVVSELTGGVLKSWPRSGGIRASTLSVKYSILHKIALKNWIPNSHSSVVRAEMATFLYALGTRGYLDFGSIVFENIMRHAEKRALQKPVGFPSLVFGIIQSQTNIMVDTDIMADEAPCIIITSKLRNAAYHVNDIAVPVMSDATGVYSEGQSFCDSGLPSFQKELVMREMELQSVFLGRMIKSFQTRKSLLDALLSDFHSAVDDATE